MMTKEALINKWRKNNKGGEERKVVENPRYFLEGFEKRAEKKKKFFDWSPVDY